MDFINSIEVLWLVELNGRSLLSSWQYASHLPFHATEQLRRRVGDPRRSVKERYPTKQRFLTATSGAADKLVRQRFLLEDDVPTILDRARRAYETLMNVSVAQDCQYLSHWRPN